MNKEDMVRILNYYELDKAKYIVISGAALTLLGIVDYAKDIDIYCDEEYYNYLIDNYGAVYERTNEYGIDAYMIDGIINFSFSYKPNEEKIIDGIKCSSLKDIIELKEHLNRNKDKELLKTLKRLYVKSDN